MARIRTIKPEYWNSPDTASCADPWARLLFIAMWNWADDHGRGLATPGELLGFAFPNDEFTVADIRRLLGEVRRGFGVKFYRVRGRSYYAIPSWDEHQKIDKRSGPKHPGPDDGDEYDPDENRRSDLGKRQDSAGSAEPSPNPRRTSGAGTGEQGNRGTGEVGNELASASSANVADAPPPADNAQSLIAEWIDHCDERPPGRVIGQVSKELKTMLDEGISPRRLRDGLAEWHRKSLHPSTLPSVVHEIATKANAPKQPTRVNEHLALVRQLAEAEQQGTLPEIGSGR